MLSVQLSVRSAGAAGVLFLSATENNKSVSAGDVSVTVGFTERQLVMFVSTGCCLF